MKQIMGIPPLISQKTTLFLDFLSFKPSKSNHPSQVSATSHTPLSVFRFRCSKDGSQKNQSHPKKITLLGVGEERKWDIIKCLYLCKPKNAGDLGLGDP